MIFMENVEVASALSVWQEPLLCSYWIFSWDAGF